MPIDSLEDMFVHQLQEMYYVEQELVDTLDEMAMKATNDNISTGFADHRDETRDHVERIENAFMAMNRTPQPVESHVFDGLEETRTEMEDQITDDDLLNTFYLGAAMKTERIEMTGYDSLTMMATELGLDDEVTDPLEANRDSEQTTFRELEALATGSEIKSLWNRLTS